MRRRVFWYEFIFRVLLHKASRLLAMLVAMALVYRWLAPEYPWWLWLPACLLAGFLGLWLWIMVSYTYQKLTYPSRAAEYKRLWRQSRGE